MTGRLQECPTSARRSRAVCGFGRCPPNQIKSTRHLKILPPATDRCVATADVLSFKQACHDFVNRLLGLEFFGLTNADMAPERSSACSRALSCLLYRALKS